MPTPHLRQDVLSFLCRTYTGYLRRTSASVIDIVHIPSAFPSDVDGLRMRGLVGGSCCRYDKQSPIAVELLNECIAAIRKTRTHRSAGRQH